jgi:hypothetical protein
MLILSPNHASFGPFFTNKLAGSDKIKMSFAANISNRMPVYFHRVREGESLGDIAAKYNVRPDTTIADNITDQPQAGAIVVIDFKASKLSLQ